MKLPKPGDRVKILALHDHDAYSEKADQYTGLIITIDKESPVREFEVGTVGFSGCDPDGQGYCFHAALVEIL